MIKTTSPSSASASPSQRFHRDPQPAPSKFLGFAVLNSPGGPGADCFGEFNVSIEPLPFINFQEKPQNSLTYLTLLHKITLSLHIQKVCCFTQETQPPTRQPPLRPLPWQDWQPLRVFLFRPGSPGRFSKSCVYFYITFNGCSKLQNAILSGSSVKCYKKSTCLYTEIYTSGLSMDLKKQHIKSFKPGILRLRPTGFDFSTSPRFNLACLQSGFFALEDRVCNDFDHLGKPSQPLPVVAMVETIFHPLPP